MFTKVNAWYNKNYTPITWFIVGYLINGALNAFLQGHVFTAAIVLFVCWLNFYCYKKEKCNGNI